MTNISNLIYIYIYIYIYIHIFNKYDISVILYLMYLNNVDTQHKNISKIAIN